MKRLTVLLISVLALSSGCTRTEFDRNGGFRRTSVFQRVEVGEIRVTPDGAVTVKGYANDGGNQAIGAAVGAAVAAAVEAAKP